MDAIETPLYRRASFRYRSPRGVIHAGRMLEMTAVCGTRIGRLGTGWQAVEMEVEPTCLNCRNVLGIHPEERRHPKDFSPAEKRIREETLVTVSCPRCKHESQARAEAEILTCPRCDKWLGPKKPPSPKWERMVRNSR